MQRRAVGIDLGTTCSYVLLCGWYEHHRVEIIYNDQGNRTMLSLLFPVFGVCFINGLKKN